jgi:hypothetical protein
VNCGLITVHASAIKVQGACNSKPNCINNSTIFQERKMFIFLLSPKEILSLHLLFMHGSYHIQMALASSSVAMAAMTPSHMV